MLLPTLAVAAGIAYLALAALLLAVGGVILVASSLPALIVALHARNKVRRDRRLGTRRAWRKVMGKVFFVGIAAPLAYLNMPFRCLGGSLLACIEDDD